MANPSPPLENLKPFKPKGKQAMAPIAMAVRLPIEIDSVIRGLGDNRSEWLRRVITEAAQRELMTPPPEQSTGDDG